MQLRFFYLFFFQDKSKIDCGYTEFNTRITFDGSLKNVNSLDSVLMISHEEMVTSTLIMPHQNIYVGYFGTNAGNLKKVNYEAKYKMKKCRIDIMNILQFYFWQFQIK